MLSTQIDVEGSELETLPLMIADGSLNNILQVGVEIHILNIEVKHMMAWTKLFNAMHGIGFRLITADVNVFSVIYYYLNRTEILSIAYQQLRQMLHIKN